MISILEERETREMVVPISREFYREAGASGLLERDVELLEGIIVRKMPKWPFHILLVRRLIEMLEAYFESKSGEGEHFVAKEDPIAAGDSEPEPDIAVLPGSPETYASNIPESADLIVEVAISTLEKDRLKAGIYASIGVPEYWVVDGNSKRIEVFTRPDSEGRRYGECRVFEQGNRVASSQFPGFDVELNRLFHTDD